ncbi:MAG: D-TA family PLP-dependent enzyme [Spirosomaceae bacterium]|nr:D-TA family PLP-dependent enzyme [Spirosomataceae bacterium]
MKPTYKINNIQDLDSPSLIIYKEVMQSNISKMTEIAGSADRLMPHVKTNKSVNVVQAMIATGINKYKCSTIAEAEMLGMAGAENVLIAHQLVGPKVNRLLSLIEKYPDTNFASLVDDFQLISKMQALFSESGKTARVYIDVNNGMNRSGAEVFKLSQLAIHIGDCKNITLEGWHVYDGHHREEAFIDRKIGIENDFESFDKFLKENPGLPQKVIAGGSPAFTVHAQNEAHICSPGTSVFWDWGYGDRFQEQTFEYAALVLTRVISKPTEGIVAIDLGHKAISAENPIEKRVRFLNLEGYELLSQSEEHGVLRVDNWEEISVGDELLGVPYHVCPTVNLYDEAYIVSENQQVDIWEIIGRKRRINC